MSDQDFIVFGEALVDRFADGDVVGGAPLNVARHLAGLGTTPLLITRLGRDAAAERVLAEMSRFGMSLGGVQRDAIHPTGTVLVHQPAAGGHCFEILPNQAYDHLSAGKVLAASRNSVQAPLYFGALAQRSPASRAALMSLFARRPGCRRHSFFDLNWREAGIASADASALLALADVIKLNDGELQMVLGWYGLPTGPLLTPPAVGSQHLAILNLMQPLKARLLVVTCGANGHAAFDRDGHCLAAGAASPVPVLRDTVGAGDAFAAVLLFGQARRWPLAQSLERASAFAAAICGLRGAAPADLDFYRQWQQQWGITLAAAFASH